MEIHPIYSVLATVVKEFLEVFPQDLPGVPPEREIDFDIVIIPYTSPMFFTIHNSTTSVEILL